MWHAVHGSSMKLYDGLSANVEKVCIQWSDSEPSTKESFTRCFEYQCLVTGLAPKHQCLFYPLWIFFFFFFFFLWLKPINSWKLECIRSRENENYFVVVCLNNSSYIFWHIIYIGSQKFFLLWIFLVFRYVRNYMAPWLLSVKSFFWHT